MDTIQRLRRAKYYNTIRTAVLAVALLYVITSPAVSKPIFDFLFAGVVPGTDYVVSPDAMMTGVVITFAVSLIAVLTVATARHFRLPPLAGRHAQTAVDQPPAAASGALEGTIYSKSSTVKSDTPQSHAPQSVAKHPGRRAAARTGKRSAASRRHTPSIFASRLTSLMSRTVISIHRVLQAVHGRFLGGLEAVVRVFTHAIRAVLRMLLRLVALTYIVAGDVSTRLQQASRSFWKRLRPHAETFDSWLEIKCRAFMKWSHTRLMRYEIIQGVVVMFRDSRDSVRRLFK